jgi:Na+-driven multidrug efflux pump
MSVLMLVIIIGFGSLIVNHQIINSLTDDIDQKLSIMKKRYLSADTFSAIYRLLRLIFMKLLSVKIPVIHKLSEKKLLWKSNI